MIDSFTITDIINLSQEYTLNSKDNTLWISMVGYGNSVDYWSEKYGWEEEDFITQDFYPLQEDKDVDDYVSDNPNTNLRFHDYKVGLQFTLSLPPNRKRGDTYTAQQVREMIHSADGWGDDTPKGGYNTYGDRDYLGELIEDCDT